MAEYIDRAAVYEKLNNLPHEYRNAEQRARTGGIAACKEIVRYFPAADVVERPRWIPVEERLPEESGEYLVYICIDDTEPFYGIVPFDADVPAFGRWEEHYDPVTYRWAGSDFVEIRDVTHWMPLPEPPNCGAEMRGES